MTAAKRVTIIAPNVAITDMHRIPSLLNALVKCVIIKCPFCGSTNIRAGKTSDNIMHCTCKAEGCGRLFEYDVVKEEVIEGKCQNPEE